MYAIVRRILISSWFVLRKDVSGLFLPLIEHVNNRALDDTCERAERGEVQHLEESRSFPKETNCFRQKSSTNLHELAESRQLA